MLMSQRQGDYYLNLASSTETTCQKNQNHFEYTTHPRTYNFMLGCIGSTGQPSVPIVLSYPRASMLCMSPLWHVQQTDCRLSKSKNNSRSPLCGLRWCTTALRGWSYPPADVHRSRCAGIGMRRVSVPVALVSSNVWCCKACGMHSQRRFAWSLIVF